MAKHEGRTFQIDITMPEGYPFEPPKMQFSTKVWLKNLEFMSKHGPYALETEQPSVRSILVQIKLTKPSSSSSSEKESHGSFAGAVFNISTSIVGAGIISIPAAFKVLGVIPFISIVVIIAWLSNVSAGFLMKSTLVGESTTYAGAMKDSFGKPGAVAVTIAS